MATKASFLGLWSKEIPTFTKASFLASPASLASSQASSKESLTSTKASFLAFPASSLASFPLVPN